MSNKMNMVFAVLSLMWAVILACPLAFATPTPASEPTAILAATATPTATLTPVVIVVTATPAPTPTVDPMELVLLPRDVARFAAQLVPLHGNDFAYFGRLGVAPDTMIYLFYESPVGSGEHYLASYGIMGGMWVISDTVRMTGFTPTPTLGPVREVMR